MIESFRSKAPQLQKIYLGIRMTHRTATILTHLPSLSSATLHLPPTISIQRGGLAFLKDMPRLGGLFLVTSGHRDSHDLPVIGEYLKHLNPKREKTQLGHLEFSADGFFTFWATSFLASQQTHKFVMKIPPLLESQFVSSVFWVPHILHLLTHRCPDILQITIGQKATPRGNYEDTLPFTIQFANDYKVERFDEPRIPEGLFPSLSRLRHLQALSIANVPFNVPDFMVQLVERLSDLLQLQELCLVPMPLIDEDDHRRPTRKLVLPTLQCLRKLSSHNLALRRVTIVLDCSEIPQDPPSLSTHRLQCLFIEPQNGKLSFDGGAAANAQLTQLVTLGRYLDHLFPNLQFLTAHDEKVSGHQINNVLEHTPKFQEGSLEMWRNVDYLLKSYQTTRKAAVGRV